MFDRCWRWRRELARHAEGKLTSGQSGRLQDHLAGCGRCRLLAEADVVLNTELNARSLMLGQDAAYAFDNRVVAATGSHGTVAMRRLSLAALAPRWKRAQARWNGATFSFLTQLAGGTVVAASITLLFLVSSLHFGNTTRRHGAGSADSVARRSLEHPDLPVPLESLLQTPSPRAALLWTTPRANVPHANGSDRAIPAPASPAGPSPNVTKPVLPDPHSALPTSGDATMPNGNVMG